MEPQNQDGLTPAEERKNRCEMAIEELKLLQAIIGRYDENAFRFRNWATALAGGIVTARFVWFPSHISPWLTAVFAIGAFIAILLVCWLEFMHRGPQRFAMDRVKVIEEQLRGQGDYDGPRIHASLTERWPFVLGPLREAGIKPWHPWKNPTPWSYFFLFLIVLMMLIVSCFRGGVVKEVTYKIEKTDKDTKTAVDFSLEASPQEQQKLLEKANNNLGLGGP